MIDRIAQFRQSFQTRKTEENDTHQYIQHHDPDFYKKKNDDEKGGFKDPYDDLTDVSVAALITFLEGLLDRNAQAHSQSTPKTPDDQPHYTQETRAPIDPAHAKAMNAYQARNPQTIMPPPRSENTLSEPQSTLDKAAAALDITVIKSTIRDLHGLSARGIDHIALERGDGFMESIQNSIKNY